MSKWKISSIFCGLFRKTQLYELTWNSKIVKKNHCCNSLHVGPVRLPHPVRMPNGRVRSRTNSESKRACSEDYTKSNTPPKGPSKKDIRSYSLKHGSVLEDYTIFEKEPTIITAAETNNSNNSNKPKVKTVPLYRAKRASR